MRERKGMARKKGWKQQRAISTPKTESSARLLLLQTQRYSAPFSFNSDAAIDGRF
jgi:hypothetical protein